MENDSELDQGIEVAAEEGELNAEQARSTTILDKIKALLSSTKADRWQQVGEPLDEGRKHQRPLEVWEQAYSTDTKAGVLVLRSSIPITCNYFGGGYSFTQAGRPRYLVELRPRGWSPKWTAEVSTRGAGPTEKNYQVLADGEVARTLFNEVEHSVHHFRDSLKVDFNDSVQRLLANILEQVEGSVASDWKIIEGEVGYTGYSGDVNGMTVTVGALKRDSVSHYSMNFSKHGFRWDCRDSRLMKSVFSVVDEAVRNASLEHLGKVLEEML